MDYIFAEKVKKSPEALVDYIGLTDDLLKDRIERLKVVKAEADAMIKAATGQRLIIAEEAAKFLTENGVEKLTGDRVSSIVVKTPKPTKSLVIDDDSVLGAYLITTLDKKAVKEDLDNNVKVDGAHLETVEHEPKITIYRRKA